MKTLKLIGYNVLEDRYTNPATGFIENLPSDPTIVSEIDVAGYEEYIELNSKFLHNRKTTLDEFVDFSEWISYQLTGFADIDANGDKTKIYWKNEAGKICIEETLIYTRSVEGVGLLATFKLQRTLSIKYYKENGMFKEDIMPTKHYSNKERIDADKKSRINIIERVREQTGAHIYVKHMMAGTPQLIEVELYACLELFKTLSTELQAYREDREHTPLVNALTILTPVSPLTQDTIDFIIVGVNIDYYPQ